MKVGISISIDVTKIEKARLYEGKKGTYLDLITFVELDEKDQYDQNGFISQAVTKDERDAGVKGPILGNCKVFWKGESSQQRQQGYSQGIAAAQGTINAGQVAVGASTDIVEDDIPFN